MAFRAVDKFFRGTTQPFVPTNMKGTVVKTAVSAVVVEVGTNKKKKRKSAAKVWMESRLRSRALNACAEGDPCPALERPTSQAIPQSDSTTDRTRGSERRRIRRQASH